MIKNTRQNGSTHRKIDYLNEHDKTKLTFYKVNEWFVKICNHERIRLNMA